MQVVSAKGHHRQTSARSNPVCRTGATTEKITKVAEKLERAGQPSVIHSQALVQELEGSERKLSPVQANVSAQGAPAGSEGLCGPLVNVE